VKVQEMEDHIENQQKVLKLLKDNLVTTQNRMKQQVDQHHNEREFEVGDWVFIRLQPYKQMSLKQQKKDNKFAPKYYGPYKLLQRIENMDYKLELPPSSHVHLVFHVSCLNKVVNDKIQVQTILPNINEEGKIIQKLETTLKQALSSREIEQLLSTLSSGRT
jgi:hypothetical protein